MTVRVENAIRIHPAMMNPHIDFCIIVHDKTQLAKAELIIQAAYLTGIQKAQENA